MLQYLLLNKTLHIHVQQNHKHAVVSEYNTEQTLSTHVLISYRLLYSFKPFYLSHLFLGVATEHVYHVIPV